MPPFLVVALGAVGAVALARVIVSETRRINAALDRNRRTPAPEPDAVKLERDPKTGDYRPRKDA